MAKRLFRCVFVCVLAMLAARCGGDSDSPTAPSAPTTPTRVISVSGNLAFGDVTVGASRANTLTITNSGNAALTVANLSVTGGLGAHMQSNWSSGTIAPGASQSVSINFAPAAAGVYSGTLTVNGDHTGGTNTIGISGTGVSAIANFAGVWTGGYVVERCDGTGSVQDLLCSSRGAYPPGSVLPIRVVLTQTGSSVSGTFALGQVTGPANGSVSSAGVLTLQGIATAGPNTAAITSWSTRLEGSRMEGNATYNLTNSAAPGVAVMVTRLNGVTK
jgi:hypothetical protein